MAAQKGKVNVVKMLIQAKAHVDIRNEVHTMSCIPTDQGWPNAAPAINLLAPTEWR